MATILCRTSLFVERAQRDVIEDSRSEKMTILLVVSGKGCASAPIGGKGRAATGTKSPIHPKNIIVKGQLLRFIARERCERMLAEPIQLAPPRHSALSTHTIPGVRLRLWPVLISITQ